MRSQGLVATRDSQAACTVTARATPDVYSLARSSQNTSARSWQSPLVRRASAKAPRHEAIRSSPSVGLCSGSRSRHAARALVAVNARGIAASSSKGARQFQRSQSTQTRHAAHMGKLRSTDPVNTCSLSARREVACQLWQPPPTTRGRRTSAIGNAWRETPRDDERYEDSSSCNPSAASAREKRRRLAAEGRPRGTVSVIAIFRPRPPAK